MAGRVSVNRDAADSATTARTEYRTAREALVLFATVAALNGFTIAARAWPLQPAYIKALLDLALRLPDTKRVAEALGMANRIRVALAASASTRIDSLPNANSLRALRKVQTSLRAPIVQGGVLRTLADSTLFPEGLGIDSRDGPVYVSSIGHRNVLAVASDGRSHMLLRDELAGVGGIFGIVVDTVRGVL